MSRYRIMSFDGGGVRGVLTAALLQRLQAQSPNLLSSTDLFAGTSTGSFIALGLAYGLTPQALAELYVHWGAVIFSPRHPNLFHPRYDNLHLRQVLATVFPHDLRLKDLGRRVVVPAFQVAGPDGGPWRPVFFNNFPGAETQDETVVSVALASSAAPTYFPSYRGYIDGGVVVNNPSTAAVSLAVAAKGGGQDLDNTCVLSLGTGASNGGITTDTTRWGVVQWAMPPTLPLLQVLFDGVVEADAAFTAQLLGPRCHRLNPPLTEQVELDEYQKIPALIGQAATTDLRATLRWLQIYWA